MNKEICSILSFYAVSPIHAGSGASVATVDLPIQRERHTGYPIIQASGVKGAMRDHFRNNVKNKSDREYLTNWIFGIDKDNDGEVVFKDGNYVSEKLEENKNYKKLEDKENKITSFPGSISVSDAKLLAFPMRSNLAPFVWVTSPTILKKLTKDLEYLNISETFGDLNIEEDNAKIIKGNFNDNSRIILEDVTVNVNANEKLESEFLNDKFPQVERLLLISDEMFDYCVTSCTEVQTNIKINSEKGTAAEGGLRYQEFLPSDSVLYSVVYFSGKSNELQADAIKKYLQESIDSFFQIGGDITLGKGICNVSWIDGGTK
ncbi:CRISPR-associated RAMP protein, Cmr4 family [Flexistipes sinusarabici DSM 4947]|uniref:CRISPR-associated RAMP protein, Cmr4 family n=1 Tax=Flexistipes sinusarabici (strain ATCC 49648 / DSM 4947 / MAS 10) TaxID=717231 RepID=F8E946_FLESM|nr:type III-B CRISPR module RAMP protein Cmr4 [Flexistipes sinusarabici]AEI15248.1 CRISPR-associated RAMP protein, Cmr4 family [Flexistipes sinusarabici DSM 4947]